MLNFLKTDKNLTVRILFVPNILLCFSFFFQKCIFILEFCIFYCFWLKKKDWGIESSLLHSNRSNSYFKIFTQSQNTKVYE